MDVIGAICVDVVLTRPQVMVARTAFGEMVIQQRPRGRQDKGHDQKDYKELCFRKSHCTIIISSISPKLTRRDAKEGWR